MARNFLWQKTKMNSWRVHINCGRRGSQTNAPLGQFNLKQMKFVALLGLSRKKKWHNCVARIICAQRMYVCDIVYAYIIASRAYHAWANIRAARLGREVNIHSEPRNNKAIINQFIISLTSARVACPLHTRAPRSQMLRTRLLWVLFSYILLEYVVS